MWHPLLAVVLFAAVHTATADCPMPPILNDFSMAKVRPLQLRPSLPSVISHSYWLAQSSSLYLVILVCSPCFRVAACRTSQLEAGTWFEIGKFQSGLGAFFEKDCVCTHLTVSPNADGTATASNGA